MRRVAMLTLLAGCQAVFRLDHVPGGDAPTSDTTRGDAMDGSGGCRVFQPRADYPALATPTSLAVADLDGDTRLDVVLGSVPASSLQPFQNTSIGFVAGTPTMATTAPASIAKGTFNADSVPDLAIVDHSGNLRLMIGTGTFAFVNGNAYTVTSAVGVAVGDYDANGTADVLVTDAANSEVHAFSGNGNGSLTPGPVGGTGMSPGPIVTANLDGDGHADFVIADTGAAFYTTFLGASTQAASRPLLDLPTGLVVADLDGDTKDDAIFTLPGSAVVEVVFATSGTARSMTPGFTPSLIAAADFDGDQHADIVFYDANSGSLVELHGNGNGTFGNNTGSAETVIPMPASVSALGVGDFNGDDRPDLAVAMGDVMPELAILLACP